MKYLGMEFKNHSELNVWNMAGHIAEYKKLSAMFEQHPSMELSTMMSDRAEVLVKQFGMTWEQIEELELAV
jgi:hypothetical protein